MTCRNCLTEVDQDGFCSCCGKLETAGHGRQVEEPPQDVFLSDDPALALVHADMPAWLQAHPCDCEASCECDRDPEA